MGLQKYLNAHPSESFAPSPATKAHLRAVMKGYRSTLDGPVNDFIPELLATYPNAKFLLTVRDSDAVWWPSFRDSVGIYFERTWRRTVFLTLTSSVHFLRRMNAMCHEIDVRVQHDLGGVDPQYYKKHNEQVRDLVPADQLLEYNVKEGWEPLCKFLGVDVPDVPFPKLNEGQSVQAVFFGQQMFGACVWAVYLSLGAGVVYLAYGSSIIVRCSRTISKYLLRARS